MSGVRVFGGVCCLVPARAFLKAGYTVPCFSGAGTAAQHNLLGSAMAYLLLWQTAAALPPRSGNGMECRSTDARQTKFGPQRVEDLCGGADVRGCGRADP